MQNPWPRIVALWLLGVLAAAQLAKMSILSPLLRARFGLSLPEIAALISLLEVGGGLFGFLAGLGLTRAGIRRYLLIGLAILTGASIVEAMANVPALLLAARAVEGVGYLFVVIAAPTAIVAVADDRSRGRALVLWSSFVPVGLGVGGMITAALVTALGARAIMAVWAGLLAMAFVGVLRLRVAGSQAHRLRLPSPAAWISTFGFGLYTMFICALTMLLPSFLMEHEGASVGLVGIVAALASLAALPGSVIAMWSTRGGGVDGRRMRAISTITLTATVPLLILLYAHTGAGLVASGAIAVLAVTVSGLVPPLVFARLPAHAGAIAADDPRIATANGLITQFGAGGALVGPPLGGLVVTIWGWGGLGVALAGLTLAMLAMIWLAEHLDDRSVLGRASVASP